jgi:putative ABC transport system substrate-binding protein
MRRRLLPTALLALVATLNVVAPAIAQSVRKPFTIGILNTGGSSGPPTALLRALRDLGYQEGGNLAFISRSAMDNAELPALASELVQANPDVLVAVSTPPSLALKQATTSIPIVILNIGDPVATGLVQSLAHPGGNVTGTANAGEVWTTKQLQMVTEMLPGVRCVTYLRNPTNAAVMAGEPRRRSDGEQLGIEFQVLNAATAEQLSQALAAPLEARCRSALLISYDRLFNVHRAQIAAAALQRKIALFASAREDAEAGALLAFGMNMEDQWRRGALYIDRILKGAKPADLPVQQPTKFEMIVNLRTARMLDVTIPVPVLARADAVIE